MTGSHTPGPWFAHGARSSATCARNWHVTSHPSEGSELVCEVDEHANARLIAASPLLLEALEAVYGWLEFEDGANGPPLFPEGVVRDSPEGERIYRAFRDKCMAMCERANRLMPAALKAARGEENRHA